MSFPRLNPERCLGEGGNPSFNNVILSGVEGWRRQSILEIDKVQILNYLTIGLKQAQACPRGVTDNASASEAGYSGSIPDGGIF